MICLWARFSCWIYPPRHSGVPAHALLHVQFLHGVHDMDLHGIPCALGIALVQELHDQPVVRDGVLQGLGAAGGQADALGNGLVQYGH